MPSTPNKQKLLWVICSAAFLVPFMGAGINLALPQISETFSMKAVTLSWTSTAYMIATAICQVPFARLADMYGRKKIFVAGIGVFSFFSFLCGWAPSGSMLILYRLLSGMGAAMMFGTNMAILTAVFPKEERGKALAVNTAVVYFALASGPFLGGILTHYFGWQSLFYVCGILGLIVFAGAVLFLKGEWIEAKGEPFDYIGSAIYAIGLFGIIYGFSSIPDPTAFVWLFVGVFAFVLFIFYELRCRYPVFNVRIFSGNKVFSLSSLSALINYASTSGVTFMISLYLQYIRGMDAQYAGMVLISQAIVQCIMSLFAGKLSEKIAPSVLATCGMAVIVVGLIGLIFLTETTPLFYIISLLGLLGLGFGLFSSPNTNVIMSSVDKKYYGQASATTGTMRQTGHAFSMGIAMMALSLHVGNNRIVPELYPEFMQSMRITFIVFALLCLIGTFASSFRAKSKGNPADTSS